MQGTDTISKPKVNPPVASNKYTYCVVSEEVGYQNVSTVKFPVPKANAALLGPAR
jgi:hypothetical protein